MMKNHTLQVTKIGSAIVALIFAITTLGWPAQESCLRPTSALERQVMEKTEIKRIMHKDGLCSNQEIQQVHTAYEMGLLDTELASYIGYLTRQALLGSELASTYRTEFNEKYEGILGMAKTGKQFEEISELGSDEITCSASGLTAIFVHLCPN